MLEKAEVLWGRASPEPAGLLSTQKRGDNHVAPEGDPLPQQFLSR